MDPTQANPQVMQMLAALQNGQGAGQGAGLANQAASLGNQPLQPGMGAPDAYQAMMNPPPMVPPPAPLY